MEFYPPSVISVNNYQFHFRHKQSTIDQINQITSIIEKALEGSKVYLAVFLDVAQAFVKAWHEDLEYKLKKYMPRQYFDILQSYMAERDFQIHHGQ